MSTTQNATGNRIRQNHNTPPSKLGLKDTWQITKKTFIQFNQDNPFNYAAIIAYYTIFSLPAVLILVIKVASQFLGQDAVSGRLFGQIKNIVGAETAATLQEIIKNASQSETSFWAATIGIATLAFSATTVFIALQDALNYIWGVKAKPEKGWLKYIVNRLLSISIVGAFAFLLLVSLSIDAVLGVVTDYLETIFNPLAVVISRILNIALSLGILTLIFALIYRVLPDARVKWRNVWTGSFITTLLFVLGKTLIGIYLGFSDTHSSYGAAGSLVLILLWVYYSALILLLGAEFTKTYSNYTGEGIQPSEHAVKVEVTEIHTDANGDIEDRVEKTGSNSMA